MSLTDPDRLRYTLNLTNAGNTRTEVMIFASESFRGWSVGLDSETGDCETTGPDFTCEIDVGETLMIEVIVRPPFSAELEDTFKFTISVEPTETGVVDRENIEFEVAGAPAKGLLGLGLSDQVVSSLGLGLVVLLGVALLPRFFRASKN